MSDIKMYDILRQFSGVDSKSMPVSTSQAEPIYESVDPLDSVAESVTAMEAKFQVFKENIVAEKTKRKSEETELGDIDSADATIQQLVNKARFSRPGAKNDLEAIVYHIAKQDEELERAKNAEEEDRELIKKAQAVTDQMNARFKKLNAKVASGQITAQDQSQAQAAQQIEKDADVAKAAVIANPAAPVQNIAEPTVKIAPTKDQEPAQAITPPQPTSNIVNFPTTDTPPATDSEKSKADNQQGKVTSINTAKKKQPIKFPGIKDLDKDLDIAAESLTEESRYREGTPEAGKYNWGLLARAWQNKLPYIDLDFGLKTVRMTDAQMYAALATWKANGVDFKSGGDPTIDNALSSRENLELFLRGRKFKEFLSAYPKVKEKAVKAAQGAKPGVTARVNPNVPRGTQEDLPLAEQNLGKNTMTKPTSIIEAVRSVEYKKLKEAAKPDFLDLDKDGDTDEPMKKAAKDAKKHEPADIDKDAVAKRKRLQALKDKQEDERDEKSNDDKSASRFVKGRAYGGAAQKDDEDKDDLEESGLQYYTGKKKYGKEGMTALATAGRKGASEEELGRIKDKYKKEDIDLNEKAVSKQQQKFMGMVHAVQKGKMKAPSKLIAKTAKSMTNKAAGDFAATKHKGLPTKVTEGKQAIRSHPIYTTKEAWDHYSQELAEQEAMEMEQSMMEAPMIDVQQELDEIAKLAGLAPKMEAKSVCPSCKCEKCKCNENLAAMAPADSASPLTHTLEGMGCTMEELEEAASRKDFRRVADRIAGMKDRIEAAKLGHAFADDFAQANPRFKKKMFLTACGLDEAACNMRSQPAAMMVGEDEMDEGNEFTGALAAAKASGSKDFEVDGKKYTVKEDININVTANGEEDVVNLIRKLSGMEAIKTVTDKLSAMSGEACGACGSTPCGCQSLEEDGPKEREVEYTNTPREEVAGIGAAIPSGADLNRAKKQYKKEYPGDNPMAESRESALWQQYETMINDVKA